MQHSTFRRGFGAFALAAILGFPGLSATDFFLDLRGGWDFLTGIFLEGEAEPPPGDSTTGGGAMDPNGGPKPKQGPPTGSHP